MKNQEIKPGFYGWVTAFTDSIDFPDGRRAARVLASRADGRIAVELAGLSGSYHISTEEFTPDPEALYWEGSCPSEEEHEAELVKLRALMSPPPPPHCISCEECQYQFPLEKLIVHSKGLLCLDCFVTDLAPGDPDDDPDDDDPQTNLRFLRDYVRGLQADRDRLTPLTAETALARWEAAINNVAIDDRYLAPGIIHQMRDALESDALLRRAKTLAKGQTSQWVRQPSDEDGVQ